jgi:hypothetical protein
LSKEKKISFRYYLNKRLKSVSGPDGDQYPVYLQVGYNRSNNQFKIGFIEDPYFTKNDFEKLFIKRGNSEINKKIDYYESQVEAIIRFEIKLRKDSFSIKGFSSRLSHYMILDTTLAIQLRCKDELLEIVEEHYSETEIKDSSQLLEFDSLRFVFLYLMIKNNFDSTIKEKVSREFVSGCKALIYFNAYLDSSISKENDDMAFQWITKGVQQRFFWYLESPDSKNIGKDYFLNMSDLVNEFGPISELEYGSVIGFISRAVIK